MNLNNRIEHNGVLYYLTYRSNYKSTNGADGWLERQFPDEKKRNEIRGKMIEHLIEAGYLRRVEPKKIELVKGGLFYMEREDG
jgi:hypothetical protein